MHNKEVDALKVLHHGLREKEIFGKEEKRKFFRDFDRGRGCDITFSPEWKHFRTPGD
jgi:hypothetical protein